ncbi:MAG: DUF2156 domain-containing protein [Terrimesophilobacter sp.]
MRYFRRIPVTLSIAAVLLAVSIISGGIFGRLSPLVGDRLGTGLDPFQDQGTIFSPITSVFLVNGAAVLIVVLVSVVLFIGAAERIMGWWRTLLAFVVTTVVGTIVGTGLQAVGVLAGEVWAVQVHGVTTIDPFTPIAGTMMTASAFAGPLWRRRIRVIGFSVLSMFALYSGQPADLFRLLSAVAGLVLGILLAPGTPELTWRRSSHSETRGLLAALLAITALGPVITIFSPAKFGPLHSLGLLFRDVLPHATTVARHCRLDLKTNTCLRDFALARLDGPGPVLLSLLPLVVLLLAAIGILQSKRFAAYLAISVNLLLAVLAAFYYGFIPVSGLPYAVLSTPRPLESTITLLVSTLVPLAVAVILMVGLRHLTVRSSKRVVLRYLIVVVSTFIVLSAAYVGIGWANRGQFRPAVTLWDLFSDSPERFIPIGFLGVERIEFVPTGVLTRLVYQWVGPVFWIVVILGALVVLGSIFHREEADERSRVRKLLERAGGGSLSFMTTWAGNRWWFAPDGSAAIAYRVVGAVAFTVSDPLGAPDARESAVRGFATYCDDNGWTAVFYSVHEDLRPIFDAMGWSTMVVGEETVLRPANWTMRGSKWQDIRSAINRAERLGIRAEWTTYSRLPLHMTTQIEEISEEWVAEQGLPELGFTLGGLAELHDPAVALMLAVGPDDRIEAITSWMPSYRDGRIVGWTLDFMRRRPESMNGIMEFLIASTVIRTQSRDVDFVSLSAVPLARSSQSDSAGTSRLLDFIATTLEPLYGFRSLLQFKSKFQPEFHTLLMAYADPLALPTIGTALARAYLPSMSVPQALRFMRTLV